MWTKTWRVCLCQLFTPNFMESLTWIIFYYTTSHKWHSSIFHKLELFYFYNFIIRWLTILSFAVLSAAGGIKVNSPKMNNGTIMFLALEILGFCSSHSLLLDCAFYWYFICCGTDYVILVAVVILVGLFSMQHYGTDKVGWLFAPIVLLWFLLIGGIGIFNIWKYDSSVLRAFSPVYIYRYFKRNGRDGWTSLGGIMLSITGKVSVC